jgi:hypothetical protein
VTAPTRRVSAESARAAAARLAGSAALRRSEQLRRMLLWLVERALTKGAPPPTESEIAESVLRRRDFHAQSDSLVRKEMGRLRSKLALYYAGEGQHDPVTIRADTGYRLAFDARDKPAAPLLLVLPPRGSADHASLFEELLIQVGESRRVDVVPPTTALGYQGRNGDVRRFAQECGADWVLDVSIRRGPEGDEAVLWLADAATGRSAAPFRLVLDGGSTIGQMAHWVLSRLAGDP